MSSAISPLIDNKKLINNNKHLVKFIIILHLFKYGY